MKAIMMSVRPQWVAKILNGEKTIEVRKKFPKDYVGWVYIYCTKEDSLGRIKDTQHDRYFVDCVETPQDFEKMDSGYDGKGKVIARFWCDKVEEIRPLMCGNFYHIEYGLTTNQLNDYLNNKVGYAIHITKLEIFDKPKELSEFYKVGYGKCAKSQGSLREQIIENYNNALKYQLHRAPQSFCFIEV